MNCLATISLRKALPVCAIPKGIFMRPVFAHSKVDKNALCCFRPEINYIVIRVFTGYRAEFSFKHQVELADVGPVTCFTDRAGYFMIFYQFFQTG